MKNRKPRPPFNGRKPYRAVDGDRLAELAKQQRRERPESLDDKFSRLVRQEIERQQIDHYLH